MWAQIIVEEALKLIKEELEGAESKLREKKESKKLPRSSPKARRS